MQNIIKKLLVLLYLFTFAKNSFSLVTSSSEGVNEFNKYQDPEAGVSLFSGNATTPQPIISMGVAGDLHLNVSLMYSGNVFNNVRAKNDVAPTSWVGLGWSLGYGSIYCIHNGTRDDSDDEYYWRSPEGVSQKIIRDGFNFYLERNPYWKVERVTHNWHTDESKLKGWILTDISGKKFIYGNPDDSRDDNNGVWNVLCWKNAIDQDGDGEPEENGYIGVGFSGEPYQFPCKWDLVAVEDLYGNFIKYYYDKIQDKLKKKGWESPEYTKASYIKRITTSKGHVVNFINEKKDPLEYLDPINYKEEPDGFMEFYEEEALKFIEIYVNVKDFYEDVIDNEYLFVRYLLCYEYINLYKGEHFKKRLLSSVTQFNNEGKNVSITQYQYLNDVEKCKEEMEDYNLGALQKIITPDCGIISYEYEKLTLNNTEPKCDFEIYEANYKVVGQGTVSGDNEYFVLTLDSDDRKLWVYTWIGYKWKKQFLGTVHGSIYCGRNNIINLTGETYLENNTLKMYFWNEKSEIWIHESECDMGDLPHLTEVNTNGNGLIFLNVITGPDGSQPDNNLKVIKVSVENRKIIYESNWENHAFLSGKYWTLRVGKNFAVVDGLGQSKTPSYRWSNLNIITFNGEKHIIQNIEIPYEGDTPPINDAYAGPDYIAAYIKKGSSEYLYVFEWTGEEWIRTLKDEVKHAKYMEIITGNNFIAIHHPINNNLTFYQYNGEKWKCVDANKNYGSEAITIKPGNDFFIARVPVLQTGRCDNDRKKEKFIIYKRDGTSWEVLTDNARMGLGKKREKKFDVGNNFYIACRRTENKYRHITKYLKVSSKNYNGRNWIGPDWIYNHKSPEGRIYPSLYAVNNALLVYERMHGVYIEENNCAGNERFEFKRTDIHIVKKINDSFNSNLSHFVVSRRIVSDEISEKEIVTNYSYTKDNLRYRTETGSAMFYEVTVFNSDFSQKKVYNFINDNLNYLGMKKSIKSYAKYKKNDENFEWRFISLNFFEYDDLLKNNTEFPEEVKCPVMTSEIVDRKGLVTETEFDYNHGNGLISKTTTKNSNGKMKIVEDIYVFEEENNNIYIEFKSKNMLNQKCQSTVYESDGIDDLKALKSVVSIWEWDNNCNAYVVRSGYIWDVNPDEQGNLPELSQFNYTTPYEQENWSKGNNISLYSNTGYPIEVRIVSDYDDGSNVSKLVYFGHNGHLKIAELRHANHDECAFLTGDYDNDEIQDNIEYFDLDNGWQKGGSLVEEPPVKHFGEKAIHVAYPDPGPLKKINGIRADKNYTFSVWVYPAKDLGNPINLSVKIGENGSHHIFPIVKLEFEKWNFVRVTIKEEHLKNIDTQGGYIIIQIKPTSGSEIFIEDIRFHPELSFPKTTFYDKFNVPVCVVDRNNQNTNIKYDWKGRIIKEYKRDRDGTGDTVFTTYEYNNITCANILNNNSKLKKLETDEFDLKFDSKKTNYSEYIKNSVEVFSLDAEAFLGAKLSLAKNGVKISDEECPCGVSQEIELEEGEPTQIDIIVTAGDGVSTTTYTLDLLRLSNCWAYSGNTDITGDISKGNILSTIEDIPCLAYIDKETGKALVKYLEGDEWKLAGAGDGSPASDNEVSNLSFISDNSKMSIAYSDKEEHGLIKVKEMNGKSGTWEQLGGAVSISWPQIISTSKHGADLYVAYTADRFEELNITPPIDEHKEHNIFIKKWDESNQVWNDEPAPDIDIPDPDIVGSTEKMQFAVSENGTRYIAYIRDIFSLEENEEIEEDFDNGKLFLLKYNGSTWDEVGSGPVSEAVVNNFSLSIDDNIPYLAYSEELSPNDASYFKDWSNTYKIVVKKFIGSWIDVDVDEPVIAKSNGTDLFKMTFVDNKPTLVLSNIYNKYKLSVIKHDGDNWITLGNPAFVQSSNDVNSKVDIAKNSQNDKFISFVNENENKVTSVMQFITAEDCADANIKNIELSACGNTVALFPEEFKQYLTNYAAEIKASCASVHITVEPRDNEGILPEVYIGDAMEPGDEADIEILPGEKEIPILVIADDGKTRSTYTVKIYRPPDYYASLCFVELYNENKDPISYSPEFDPNHFSYTANVSYEIENAIIKHITNKSVYVQIDGKINPSEYFSNPVSLKYGDNNIPIKVSSFDKKVNYEYVINIIREIDADISFSSLTVNGTSLDIDNTTRDYNINYLNSVTSVTLTP